MPAENASGDEKERDPRPTGLCRSLSAKLLVLTALFVFLGVVLIFLPTLSSFRLTWLKDRVAMAEVATLAVSAAPNNMVSERLRDELLNSAGVLVVVVRTKDARRLVLQSARPPMAKARYDLRGLSWWRALKDTFETLLAGGERAIVVIDRPPTIKAEFIELAMDERPLYAALVAHSATILKYALVLALIAGVVLFLALHVLFIRPVRRLGRAMARFGEAPEDAPPLPASGRRDEIGDLERAFAGMQGQVRELLREKSRLAALGAAVARIAHELRNMLTAAHMISDRLTMVEDPLVQRFAPKLLQSVDRAITFCTATLKYGRLREPEPRRQRIPLRDVVADVFGAIPQRQGIAFINRVPADVLVDADPDQLFRALFNLAHNAAKALAEQPPGEDEPRIEITAARADGGVDITVADNGPGLPKKVRDHLFEPFVGASAASGGAGLGLAITREIMRRHNGTIALVEEEGRRGVTFRLFIPDRLHMVRNSAARKRA
jgi:signal transduction histidine kinase